MKIRGEQREPFTRKMWDRWLARLNQGPDPSLAAGIQEMRDLLQCRCLAGIEEHPDWRITQNYGTTR
jgi:hypothetical protein